jgi:hypothetical protein
MKDMCLIDKVNLIFKYIYIVVKVIFIFLFMLPFTLIKILIWRIVCIREFKYALLKNGLNKRTANDLAKNYPSIAKILKQL